MSKYKYEGYGVVRDTEIDFPYHTDDIVELLDEKDQNIANLEAKLAESEKERELDNSFWKQECDGLQKALAEKTLTIEQINKAFIGNRSLWKGKYERANQDKISFAVEQLEKIKDDLLDIGSPYWQYFKSGNAFMTYEDIEQWTKEFIDNKIKSLKGENK